MPDSRVYGFTDSIYYSDIAAAIRYKAESSETYEPSEMAGAIRAISSGGDLVLRSPIPSSNAYALSTIVGSYFEAAGVDITFAEGTTKDSIAGFYNKIVADYDTSTSTTNNYFDSSTGEFIGSESDCRIILSNDIVGYWSIGKEFATWLEALKEDFVTDKSITSESSVIYDFFGIHFGNSYYQVYKGSSPGFGNATLYSKYDVLTVMSYTRPFSYSVQISENLFIKFFAGASGNATFGFYDSSDNAYGTKNVAVGGGYHFILCYEESPTYLSLHAYGSSSNSHLGGAYYSGSTANLFSSITVNGVLTSDYQTFKSAITSALTNASANAVFAFNAKTIEDAFTQKSVSGDIVMNEVMDEIVDGTIDADYVDVYTDEATFEESLGLVLSVMHYQSSGSELPFFDIIQNFESENQYQIFTYGSKTIISYVATVADARTARGMIINSKYGRDLTFSYISTNEVRGKCQSGSCEKTAILPDIVASGTGRINYADKDPGYTHQVVYNSDNYMFFAVYGGNGGDRVDIIITLV